MSVDVQRSPADKPGEAIVSEILTTVASQVECGTYAINDTADDRINYSGSVFGLYYYEPGDMAEVDNFGVIKNGLISRCAGSIKLGDNPTIKTTITVECIK